MKCHSLSAGSQPVRRSEAAGQFGTGCIQEVRYLSVRWPTVSCWCSRGTTYFWPCPGTERTSQRQGGLLHVLHQPAFIFPAHQSCLRLHVGLDMVSLLVMCRWVQRYVRAAPALKHLDHTPTFIASYWSKQMVSRILLMSVVYFKSYVHK